MSYGLENFLDLRGLLVNELFGGVLLFLIGTMALIFYLCAKLGLENRSTLLILLSYIIIISAVLSDVLYAIALFIVAIIFAPILHKIFTR